MVLPMMISDLFNNWEGPGVLMVRDTADVLVLDGNPIPPDQTWFLRIVDATVEERAALKDAGYRLKDAC